MTRSAPDTPKLLCQVGRIYNPTHPTCRSCQIGCSVQAIESAAAKLPSLPDADDVARMRGKKPPSRYRSETVTVEGEKFASKKQYARWCQLKMLEKAGKISNLEREVPFELAPAVTLDGRKKPAVRYFADAVYDEDGAKVVEDTKSPITRRDPVYRLKKHLMMSVYGIEIRES